MGDQWPWPTNQPGPEEYPQLTFTSPSAHGSQISASLETVTWNTELSGTHHWSDDAVTNWLYMPNAKYYKLGGDWTFGNSGFGLDYDSNKILYFRATSALSSHVDFNFNGNAYLNGDGPTFLEGSFTLKW